jgi:F-type H+-transporting ATPase subunit delta
MKLSKEARAGAKALFKCCSGPTGVDAGRVKAVIDQIRSKKPAGSAQILHEFFRLIRLELDKHTAHVETASELSESSRASMEAALRKKFGSHVGVQYSLEPALISGVRVRLGSDVWDANVRERLKSLEYSLAH